MTESIRLTSIGTYETDIFDESAAEIPAYDPISQRLFVVNANSASVEVLDLSNPSSPTKINEIDATDYGGIANSVAIKNGVVAVAIESENTQEPGQVVFFDTNGNFLNSVTVGALPDMLTFTPDGQKVLVANEGEPNDDYTVDPEGSVSIIDISGGVANATVTTADFSNFNAQIDALRESGVRIFGPEATVAQDVEPEYIAISEDSTTAWVALQENNALAVLDINSGQITDILPLGFKEHNASGNGLDASNRDDEINIQNLPVLGMYQPDAIATFEANGETFIVTANEGDSRDYDAFSEEAQVGDLDLDPTAFPNADALQNDEALGRLSVTTANGDTDGDGDFDQLYAFGGRSFSIRDAQGNLVYDSGDDFERITAQLIPENFNSNNDENDSFDSRSDDKGPEPEGVVTGVIDGRTYAFIGLERVGGIMVYDISNPTTPSFVQYINNRDFSGDPEAGTAGDLAPEGLTFISAEDSPNGKPLLVTANEVSGSTSIYEINEFTPIYNIQGAAQTSPLEGDSVTTIGIVTAVDSNGFYLQDPTGDGNDATSDGIFVFTGSAPTVTIGDELQVEGTVSEFVPRNAASGSLSTTQIGGNPTITTLSTGNSLPTAVILGAEGRIPPTEVIDNDDLEVFDPAEDGIDFYESLEGMRVEVQDAVAVSPTNRFGEIFTLADNGVDATGVNDRGGITIRPEDFNPERIQIQLDRDLLPDFSAPVNVGAALGDVTGVVGYSFGNFEVLATEEFSPTASDLEPETSNLVGTDDQLTVASYNLLNLDPKVEDQALVNRSSDIDDDLSEGQFDAIASQIVENLNSPDIISLQEIQDNDGAEQTDVVDASLTYQTLIDEIVAAGGPQYEFFDIPPEDDQSGGQPGGNIRVGYLYNPDRVDLIEGSGERLEDPNLADGDAFEDSRNPLAAEFLFNGQEVSIVNNHFTSKGGSSPLFGDIQPPINGGEEQREEQAQIVNNYVDEILADDPNANVVVLGDLNEFQFFSPIQVLKGGENPVLTNLTETLPEEERYSYIFEGNSQVLDHILVSDNLAASAEYDPVHVNSEFTNQASDHDPVLSRFELAVPDGVLWGSTGSDELVGTQEDETLYGRAGDDTVAGGLGDDLIFGDEGEDVLRGDLNSRDPGGTVGGDDTIYGGAGNDRIGGKAGDDSLYGEAGDDQIYGDDGDDLLRGGLGNDTLVGDDFSGGNGSDTFVLALGEGMDTILDFKVGDDLIALADGLMFEQLSITQSGSNTLIDSSDVTLAILNGVDANSLIANASTTFSMI